MVIQKILGMAYVQDNARTKLILYCNYYINSICQAYRAMYGTDIELVGGIMSGFRKDR